MKILIFDDDNKDIEHLLYCIDTFFNKVSLPYKYKICKTDEELMSNIQYYDLVFLDIEINNLNGITIGKNIREINKDIQIILTTNYKKYLIDGYKIKADRYFLKPISLTEFCIELQDVLKEYLYYNNGFYEPKLYKKKIYYKNVLYVEFINRKSYLHLNNGETLESNEGFNIWKEKFKDFYFAQSHKSFLVNLINISGFHKNDIILINNETVPISRHYKESFENEYFLFIHKGV